MRTIRGWVDVMLAVAVLGVGPIGHADSRGALIAQAGPGTRLAQGLTMPSVEVTPGRLGTITDRHMGAPPAGAVAGPPAGAAGAPPLGAVGAPPVGAVGSAPVGAVGGAPAGPAGAAPQVAPLARPGAVRR